MSFYSENAASIQKYMRMLAQVRLDYDKDGNSRSEYGAETLYTLLDDIPDPRVARFCLTKTCKNVPDTSDLSQCLFAWWLTSLSRDGNRLTPDHLIESITAYDALIRKPRLTLQLGKLVLELAKAEILNTSAENRATTMPFLLLTPRADIKAQSEAANNLLAAAIVCTAPFIAMPDRQAFIRDVFVLAVKTNREDLDQLVLKLLPEASPQLLSSMARAIGKTDTTESKALHRGARFLPAIAAAYPASLMALAEANPELAANQYDILHYQFHTGMACATSPDQLPLARLFTRLAQTSTSLTAQRALEVLSKLPDYPAQKMFLQQIARHAAEVPVGPVLEFQARLHNHVAGTALIYDSRPGLLASFGRLNTTEQIAQVDSVCRFAIRDLHLRFAICKAFPENWSLRPS